MKKMICVLFLLVGCSQKPSVELDRYDLSYVEWNNGKHLNEINSDLDVELMGTWIIDSEDMTYRSMMVLYPNGTALLLENASYGFSARVFQYKSKNDTLILLNQSKDHYGVPYYLVWEMGYIVEENSEGQTELVMDDRVYVKAEVNQQ